MTQLVNIHHGTRYDVDIRRPGKYGNPIILGATCPQCGAVHTRKHDGTAALVCTARHFYGRLRDDAEFGARALKLRGQTLGCVCAPAPCHGDILIAYVVAYTERLATSAYATLAHASGLVAIRRLANTWKNGQQVLGI